MGSGDKTRKVLLCELHVRLQEKILGVVEVCKVVGEAHVGLDTVLIATDSAATELGGTLFLIGGIWE